MKIVAACELAEPSADGARLCSQVIAPEVEAALDRGAVSDAFPRPDASSAWIIAIVARPERSCPCRAWHTCRYPALDNAPG